MATSLSAPRPDATERVMELMMYLLAREVPKTRGQIWRDTGLYAPADTTNRQVLASARASFERDKALIRNLGVRITEMYEQDGATSYTIRREDYFLPDLGLTREERLALQYAAARVDIGETWDLEAAAKLAVDPVKAPGAPDAEATDAEGGASLPVAEVVDAASLPVAEVELDAASVAERHARTLLPTLAAAAADRANVRFVYAGRRREVCPLGLLGRASYWYLAAVEGGTAKTFRVDRMEGKVAIGEPGDFAEQSDIDVAGLLPSEPMEMDFGDNFVARVRIDAVMVQQSIAERGRVMERHDDGAVIVEATVRNRTAFRSWILDMGRHALVLSPPELVADVTSWLRAIVDDSAVDTAGDVAEGSAGDDAEAAADVAGAGQGASL